MKKTIFCLLAFFVWMTPALAQNPGGGADPYHDWFTYYYLNKDASKVPDFLKWLQDSQTMEKDSDKIWPIEGFLSILFAGNPDKADGWAHGYAYTGKVQEVIDYGTKPPVTPEKQDVKTSADIGVMWGAFFASGNTAYIQKIVDVLNNAKPLTGNAAVDNQTRSVAAFSLGSNMTEHEAVDRFVRSVIAGRTDATGEALKKIAADVDKQREARAFPIHDGGFSAAMIVTDPALVGRELAKPSNDIVHLKELPTVRVGQKRTTVIVFAGMQLGPDYQADVTYDAKLTDPAEKTYSDLKDLEAIKQKVPTPFRIFSNKAAIFLSFDKKDPKGIYIADVTLKDNIGKKTLALSTRFTLKK